MFKYVIMVNYFIVKLDIRRPIIAVNKILKQSRCTYTAGHKMLKSVCE